MGTRLVDALYPAWPKKDERQDIRIAVAWNATISADKFDEQPVRITDCTARGCRIATRLAVTVGTFVQVTIPQFAAVPGWVAWSSPEAIGIDFSHPLPNRVLECVIERNAPF
jgi:hypothetical protein